jgi:hypothetical protein
MVALLECVDVLSILIMYYNTTVRKVSDLIFLNENLVDFNEVRLHEMTLNLQMHA